MNPEDGYSSLTSAEKLVDEVEVDGALGANNHILLMFTIGKQENYVCILHRKKNTEVVGLLHREDEEMWMSDKRKNCYFPSTPANEPTFDLEEGVKKNNNYGLR